MTTPRRHRRSRNARLLAHIAVIEQALAYLLRVDPPPPGSPELWIRNIETLLEGPLFQDWSDNNKAQFLTDARLALVALLRPPRSGPPGA